MCAANWQKNRAPVTHIFLCQPNFRKQRPTTIQLMSTILALILKQYSLRDWIVARTAVINLLTATPIFAMIYLKNTANWIVIIKSWLSILFSITDYYSWVNFRLQITLFEKFMKNFYLRLPHTAKVLMLLEKGKDREPRECCVYYSSKSKSTTM